MKIVHVLPYAERGGVEKNCLLFIKYSQEFDHEIWILNGQGPMVADWSEIVSKIHVLDILHENNYKFYQNLNQVKKGIKADILIYWSTVKLPLILSVFRNSAREIRVHLGNPYNLHILSAIIFLFAGIILPKPKKVRIKGVSQKVVKSYLNKPYFRNFDITPGYKPIEIPVKNRYDIQVFQKESNIELGMVARLDPIKDHHTLLHSFFLVQKEYPNSTLHIIGDGILRDDLEKLVAALSLDRKVIFHGEVKDVARYLKKLDLFIYCTTEKDGLAGTVAEAAVNSIPVICTDISSLREYFDSERSVAWVPPNDHTILAKKVIETLASPRKMEEMVETAYGEIASKFDPESFIHRFLEL